MRKALSFAFILLMLPFFLCAKENESEDLDILVIPRSSTLNQDFFAYGKAIEISGTINGDVYIFGGQVFIDGTVNGDVLVAAGSVEISGKVSQDVRLLSGQASISGEIGRNVTAVTATIDLAPHARIGNNVVILSGNVDIEAAVGNQARIYASNLRVTSPIGGNLLAYIGQMRMTSNARVGGSVEYWSNNDALIDSDAAIGGSLVHHPSFFYHVFHGKFFKSLKIGSRLAALIMNFFYTFVIALIMMRYFPQRIESTFSVLTNKPVQALLAGVVLVIVLPLLFIALLITIVGIPFALTLLAINVVGFYTAKILIIFWSAKYLFIKMDFKKHMRLYFAVSLILYYVLTLIPYLGMVISFGALLFGLGGLVLGKMNQKERKRLRDLI